MINVIHFKDGVVKVIDNSDPTLKVQTWTESYFMRRYDGWAITLVPPEKPIDNNPMTPRPPSSIK